MHRSRPLPWIIYALCAMLVLDGLGWVTWRVVQLERERIASQREASMQQTLRVALWRMDSQVAPVLAAEAARPFFQYRPLIPADRVYAELGGSIEPEEDAVVSPLASGTGRFILLHFEFAHDGTLRSPQAPTGWARRRVIDRLDNRAMIDRAGADLEALRAMLDLAGADTLSTLDGVSPAPTHTLDPESDPSRIRDNREDDRAAGGRSDEHPPTPNNADAERASDFAARSQLADQAKATPPEQSAYLNLQRRSDNELGQAPRAGRLPDAPPGSGTAGARDASSQFGDALPVIDQGPFETTWIEDPSTGRPELIAHRVVRISDRRLIQGFWVDWASLRRALIGGISDLLPDADLLPVATDTRHAAWDEAGARTGGVPPGRRTARLATIPARLISAQVPGPPAGAPRSMGATLILAWGAVVAAIAAIGVVLHASIRLSARRAGFVSAVTHELRTPLTTFCLYTQMLSEQVVDDESRRRDYIETLRRESIRLAGIVENVLSYAGLTRTERSRTDHDPAPLGPMLDEIVPGLDRRARESSKRLVVELDADAKQAAVPNERDTIERILTNLVDNACRYAAHADDDRVHLRASLWRSRVRIEVADHGPGVGSRERRRIFRAFRRAESGTGDGSGLGLGLALSRALSRRLGGRLELVSGSQPGAVFRLTLPRAR